MIDLTRASNGFKVSGRKPIAVEGETYGLVTVLERIEPDVRGMGIPARYLCRCICGTLFEADGAAIVRKRRRSCGCRNYRGRRR